uniref:Collectin-12 n=1 Tax=Magallana gigas TaxID=29159 RepID=K1QHF1_MAGGI
MGRSSCYTQFDHVYPQNSLQRKSLLSVKTENQKYSSINAIFEMPRFSKENRERCVGMLQACMSQNTVAATVGTSQKTISLLWKSFQNTEYTDDRSRGGRPGVTTRQIRLLHLRNRFLAAADSAENALGRMISSQTVRNRLKRCGLKACRPYKGTETNNRTCGTGVTCNLQSKCIHTTFDQFVCMPSYINLTLHSLFFPLLLFDICKLKFKKFCSDPPNIPNCYIAQQTFSPPSVTYGCDFGYIGVGNNSTSCVPGKNWNTEGYKCAPICVYGGVHSYGGKKYCVVQGQRSWMNAKDYCYQINAHLMEIESAEEQNWIASKVPGLGCIWIGLTDQETEGIWRWSHSHSAPQNPQWLDGQPDGGTVQNCAMLYKGGWDDYPCDSNLLFICEK